MKKALAWIGVALMLNGGLGWAQTPPAIAVFPETSVEAPYDFGPVTVGSTNRWTFVASNTGGVTLTIQSIQVDAGSGPEFSLVMLPALPVDLTSGQLANFEVQFAPSGTGVKDGTVTITCDPPGATKVVYLRGAGIEAMTVDPATSAESPYDFGTVAWGSSVTKTFGIINRGNAPLRINSVRFDGPGDGSFLLVDPPADFTDVPVGQSVTFGVKFDPQVAGPTSHSLTINYLAGSIEKVYVKGTGQAPPPAIAVFPETSVEAPYDFGPVTVGSTNRWTFVVSNTGGGTLTIQSIQVDAGSGPEFSLVMLPALPVDLTSGQLANFEVQFAPSGTGVKGGTVTITCDPSVAPKVVYLRGAGIEAMTVDPATSAESPYDFGTVAWGSSVTKTFEIINSGNAPLMINSVRFDGPGDGSFLLVDPPADFVDVPVGQSVTFGVKFDPQVAGPTSHSLTINYLAGSIEKVYVKGTGHDADLPPTLVLNGRDPLFLELGTAYEEPGATASDPEDGDLTAAIEIDGEVDSETEGPHTIRYSVTDAGGNTISAVRTVHVVVTPNSYALIALHSMDINQKAVLHSGFAGVVGFGEPRFRAGERELVVGQNVFASPSVRISAPRVEVRQKAEIQGRLVSSEPEISNKADVAIVEVVGPEHWPLFGPAPAAFPLPPFLVGSPGSQNIVVGQKGLHTFTPGAYGEIKARQKSTLTFQPGEYHIRDLDIGQNVDVVFNGPATLLIAERFGLDQKSSFGLSPASDAQAADILVYVAGINGNSGNLSANPDAAKVGQHCVLAANLYVPNGSLHLGQKSIVTGSFVGKDVIVGQNVEVALKSGWRTVNVDYDPSAPVVAKPAATVIPRDPDPEPTIFSARQNHPNPFNPSTTIRYTLDEPVDVRLVIYNALGQEIRMLVSDFQASGDHTVVWDGRNASGNLVASGLYFYRLDAGPRVAVRKMVLLK